MNGYEVHINEISNDMIHFGFPQYNTKNQKTDSIVQVDILLTEYPDFTKFYMYSPTELESKYKGAHRNSLLCSIAYITSFEPILYNNDGKLVTWKQNDITSTGFYKNTKTTVDECGNRLKYKDTDEDLLDAYAKTIQSFGISHDPNYVIHELVGDYEESDINTFEKLFNIILNDENFKYMIDATEILQHCAQTISENNNLILPFELEPFFK